MNRTLVVAALLACVGPAAPAQELALPVTGTRVRVTPPDAWSVQRAGTLMRFTSDTIWLSLPRRDLLVAERSALGDTLLALPLTTRTQLDVSRGARSPESGFARGAGQGLLVGGLIGAVLGTASYNPGAFLGPDSRVDSAVWGAFFFGGLGAAGGAIIGLAKPGERWQRLKSPVADQRAR